MNLFPDLNIVVNVFLFLSFVELPFTKFTNLEENVTNVFYSNKNIFWSFYTNQNAKYNLLVRHKRTYVMLQYSYWEFPKDIFYISFQFLDTRACKKS